MKNALYRRCIVLEITAPANRKTKCSRCGNQKIFICNNTDVFVISPICAFYLGYANFGTLSTATSLVQYDAYTDKLLFTAKYSFNNY